MAISPEEMDIITFGILNDDYHFVTEYQSVRTEHDVEKVFLKLHSRPVFRKYMLSIDTTSAFTSTVLSEKELFLIGKFEVDVSTGKLLEWRKGDTFHFDYVINSHVPFPIELKALNWRKPKCHY